MLYSVRVTQTLEGYVDIEADTPEEAEAFAFDRFVSCGESLDECNMDDCETLQFEVQN